jgi:hypothetical protein
MIVGATREKVCRRVAASHRRFWGCRSVVSKTARLRQRDKILSLPKPPFIWVRHCDSYNTHCDHACDRRDFIRLGLRGAGIPQPVPDRAFVDPSRSAILRWLTPRAAGDFEKSAPAPSSFTWPSLCKRTSADGRFAYLPGSCPAVDRMRASFALDRSSEQMEN